jgi:hypothetical protein
VNEEIRALVAASEMGEEDGEDCDSAETIESGIVRAGGACFVGWRN